MNNLLLPRTHKSIRPKLALKARRRETLEEANARVNRELSLYWRREQVKQMRAVRPALISMRPY